VIEALMHDALEPPRPDTTLLGLQKKIGATAAAMEKAATAKDC
jgi:hypothetical protein